MSDHVLVGEGGEVLKYPYSIADLYNDNPGTSFAADLPPERLADYGVFPVVPAEPPPATAAREVRPDNPELVDGEWSQRWMVVDLPLEEAKQSLLAELAAKRWDRETAGVTVEGMPIKTDRESQALLTTVYFKAKLDPNFTVVWKAAPGVHVPVTGTQLVEVGDVAFAHVQACFAREAELADLITGVVDHSALDAIDIDEDWP